MMWEAMNHVHSSFWSLMPIYISKACPILSL